MFYLHFYFDNLVTKHPRAHFVNKLLLLLVVFPINVSRVKDDHLLDANATTARIGRQVAVYDKDDGLFRPLCHVLSVLLWDDG